MSYPTIYNVTYSYSGFQQAQGDNSFPGTQLDADLIGLHDSVSALALFVRGVMRSDGVLNNGAVTYDSLSTELQGVQIKPAVAWTTATLFYVNTTIVADSNIYRSAVQHTSGVFATDLAAGKWVFVAALPVGTQLRSGAVPPTTPIGFDGDFYIDSTANTIYGPKTAGAWGSARSLNGPQRAFFVDDYYLTSDGADWTRAINACIAAAKAASSTTGATVEFGYGTYECGSINVTGVANFPGGLIIKGQGRRATLLRSIHQASNMPIFDCTGSSGVYIRDMSSCSQLGDGTAPTNKASSAVLFGEAAAGSANVCFIENTTMLGFFTRSVVEFYGCTNSGASKSDFQNYQATAIGRAVHVNGNAADPPQSLYATVNPSNPSAVNEITFDLVEFHPRFQGSDGGRAIQISSASNSIANVNNINFNNCLVDCSAAAEAHVYISGYVRNVGFINSKFYSEGGFLSQHILEVPGANNVENITFLNCQWSLGGVQTSAFEGPGISVINGRMIGCGPKSFLTGPELVNFTESLATVGGSAVTLAGDVTKYLTLGGFDLSDANATFPLARGGSIVGMRCKTGGSPGAGQAYVFTLYKNGAATAITASIAGSNTSATDTTHIVSVNAGDTISVQADPSAGAASTGSCWAALGFIPG